MRPHRNFLSRPQNSSTSHIVIESTETITSGTTTPQKWPPHESPTVAGTREFFLIPALSSFSGNWAGKRDSERRTLRLTQVSLQLQHHVQPDACDQDSWRPAARSAHQEARHCPQVRRLRHQAPGCKLICFSITKEEKAKEPGWGREFFLGIKTDTA